METDFIQRSLKVSTVVAIIFTPFLFHYLGSPFALGFIAGAAWNILNIFLLSKTLSMFIQPAASKKMWGTISGIVKFPVLYGIGYMIIVYTNVSLYGIIVGFSLALTVFLLKALGSYYTDVFCRETRSYGKDA